MYSLRVLEARAEYIQAPIAEQDVGSHGAVTKSSGSTMDIGSHVENRTTQRLHSGSKQAVHQSDGLESQELVHQYAELGLNESNSGSALGSKPSDSNHAGTTKRLAGRSGVEESKGLDSVVPLANPTRELTVDWQATRANLSASGRKEDSNSAHDNLASPDRVLHKQKEEDITQPLKEPEGISRKGHSEDSSSSLCFYSGNPVIEVISGRLHLYRAHPLSPKKSTQNSVENLSQAVITSNENGDEYCPADPPSSWQSLPAKRNTKICILSVPSCVSPRELLDFLGGFRDSLRCVRILRDRAPLNYMALLHLRSQEAADSLYQCYNGKLFNSLEPDRCIMVFISSIEFDERSEDPEGRKRELPCSITSELDICPDKSANEEQSSAEEGAIARETFAGGAAPEVQKRLDTPSGKRKKKKKKRRNSRNDSKQEAITNDYGDEGRDQEAYEACGQLTSKGGPGQVIQGLQLKGVQADSLELENTPKSAEAQASRAPSSASAASNSSANSVGRGSSEVADADTGASSCSPACVSSRALEGTTELPTCPVCLERLDPSCSGVFTTVCNHHFHCDCLSRWRDSSCPVCRFCQTWQEEESCCEVCGTRESLWICLVCGNIGCGRYESEHAKEHYQRTMHTYSLELTTQRVWDYAGDGFVHRLIQNKKDGKLIELPEPGSHRGDRSQVPPRTDVTDELMTQKMEALAMEYNQLLVNQLEEQRRYYQSLLDKQNEGTAGPNSSSVNSGGDSGNCSSGTSKTNDRASDRLVSKDLLLQSQRERKALDRKVHKLELQLRDKEEELSFLRELNQSLTENQQQWEKRVAELEALRATEIKEQKERLHELEAQVRDLMFYLDTQNKVESSDNKEEVQKGFLLVEESPSKTGQTKSHKRHNRTKK